MTMDLANAIIQLLYTQECVVVPDFGAFITRKHSAQIDTVRNAFRPPYNEIVFNPHLRNNDGVLLAYLAENENISEKEALAELRKIITVGVADMVLGKKMELKNLGFFFLENDEINFECATNLNCNADAFGLSAFTMLPINREKEHGISVNDKRIITRRLHRNRIAASVAAVLVLALAIVGGLNQNVVSKVKNYAGWIPFFYASPNEFVVRNIEAFSPSKFAVEAPKVELLPANMPEKKQVAVVVDVIAVAETTVVAEEQITSVEKQYFVVVGSFGCRQNAEKLNKQFCKKGYSSSVIQSDDKTMWRVVCYQTINRDDAFRFLKEARTLFNKNAWILAQ